MQDNAVDHLSNALGANIRQPWVGLVTRKDTQDLGHPLENNRHQTQCWP